MAFSEKWKEILDEVDSFSKENYGCVWYRGISKVRYKLESGLFRLNISKKAEEYIAIEEQMYMYFKTLGNLLHSDEDAWQLLYSMQHHGVKTRLLDWSESFAVALFFAISGWKGEGKASMCMLNPIKLNAISTGKGEILSPSKIDYWEKFKDINQKTIAIYPIKNNMRIAAQHGVFTVQGNTLQSIEDEFNDTLIKNAGIKKIELPFDVREDAVSFLQQNGINDFSLFPDLDGLAKHINAVLLRPTWL